MVVCLLSLLFGCCLLFTVALCWLFGVGFSLWIVLGTLVVGFAFAGLCLVCLGVYCILVELFVLICFECVCFLFGFTCACFVGVWMFVLCFVLIVI